MITNPIIQTGTNESLTGLTFFQRLIPSLLGVAFIVGALIFVFNLVIGAIQWISSGGEKEAVGQSRKRISNALIGLVVLLAVFAIIKIIELFFNIKILTLDIDALIIK